MASNALFLAIWKAVQDCHSMVVRMLIWDKGEVINTRHMIIKSMYYPTKSFTCSKRNRTTPLGLVLRYELDLYNGVHSSLEVCFCMDSHMGLLNILRQAQESQVLLTASR